MKKIEMLVCFFAFFTGHTFSQENQTKSFNMLGSPTCDMSIKFIVKKIQNAQNGVEIKSDVEVVINPLEKTIRIKSIHKKKGVIEFVTNIVKIECNLEENLSKGDAKYVGYTIKPNGEKTPTFIVLIVKSGRILIAQKQDEKEAEAYYMVVESWSQII